MRAENWIVGAINLERAGFGSSTTARMDVPSTLDYGGDHPFLTTAQTFCQVQRFSCVYTDTVSRIHLGHSYINQIRLIKGFMQDRGKNRQFVVNCAVTPEPWDLTGLV
jgi:hypothetical protein